MKPPPQRPPADDLEALIEEARRRQRRRQGLIGVGVLAAVLVAGVVAYLVVDHSTATQARRRPSTRPAPTRPVAPLHEIVFAADGKAVGFGEVYRVDLDGHRTDLSRSPWRDVAPAVSPNGKWVAFLSDRGGRAALYATNIRSRVLVRLTPKLFPVHDGLDGYQRVAWSPDGSKLAFNGDASGGTGSESSVYVTAFGSGRVARVAANTVPWFDPRTQSETRIVSPDGSWVASLRSLGSSSLAAPWTLTISRPDGSRRRTLLRTAPCARDWGLPVANVQFAGRALVYATFCAEPLGSLYAMRPDGSHIRRLTHTIADFGGGALSPDGRSIAFGRADAVPCKGCSDALWVMDASGRHARQLTFPRSELEETDGGASWSPDGQHIVFSRSTALFPGALYVVAASGGRAPRALHVSGGQVEWGPKQIAFTDEDFTALWTMNPDGSGRRRIARGHISAPAWSNQGDLAYLTDYGRKVEVIGRRRLTFRLRLTADTIAWSPDAKLLLITARRGTEPSELYELNLRSRRLRRLTSGLGSIGEVSWR